MSDHNEPQIKALPQAFPSRPHSAPVRVPGAVLRWVTRCSHNPTPSQSGRSPGHQAGTVWAPAEPNGTCSWLRGQPTSSATSCRTQGPSPPSAPDLPTASSQGTCGRPSPLIHGGGGFHPTARPWVTGSSRKIPVSGPADRGSSRTPHTGVPRMRAGCPLALSSLWGPAPHPGMPRSLS